MKTLQHYLLFLLVGLSVAACSSEQEQGKSPSPAASVTKTQPAMRESLEPVDAEQADAPDLKAAAVTKTGAPVEGAVDAEPATREVKEEQADTVVATSEPVAVDYDGLAPTVLDISERSHDGGNALAVTFSVPLDPSRDYASSFSVSAKEEGEAEGAWVLSENGKIMYFPQTQPRKEYSITVYRGLKANNGEKLADTVRQTVKTRDVAASVSFTSKGNFLPRDLAGGVPIASINIDEVDVNYHRVKPDQVSAFLSNMGNVQRLYRYSLKEVSSFTELVHTARYSLNPPANKRREYNLPVAEIEALKQPGIYLAAMEVPGEYYDDVSVTYFTVTDIGLHLRRYQGQLDVFASSLKTGQAMVDLDVSLLDSQGRAIESHDTGPEGQTYFKQLKKAYFVMAQNGADTTIVNLNKPALDLSDFELGQRPFRPRELFIYGPRDLYRPGEEVTISALLRDFDAQATRTTPLKAKIKKPDGQTVHDFSWQPGKEGYYETRYVLASNASTGTWRLEVEGIDKTPVSYEFKVEEFLPERMKLSFNPQNKPSVFAANETVNIDVLGEYLYGAPAAGNRFEPTVSVSRDKYAVESLKGFQFGDENDAGRFKNRFTQDDLKLDASGRGKVAINSRWEQTRSPLAVRVTGSLYESGGRPVTRSYKAQVWPADKLVGIRPSFGDGEADQNSHVEFEVVYVDVQGQRYAANDLEVVLIREDRRYFWEFSNSQGWHYEFVEREYPELTRNLAIKQGETAKISVPVEYGAYRLEVRDLSKNTLSSVRFHAGPDWYYWWRHNEQAGQAARPDKVSLAWDKAAYKAGDKARLKIVPPEAGEVLVMVEAEKPLFMERISVPKDGASIEIPIGRKWNRHDLYVTALHLRPGDKARQITPHRSLGLIHLPLDREDRRLSVSLDIADKIVPNKRYNTGIKVEGAKGQAYVTLAAVDVGVLSITDFETPKPFDWFFEPRRYQVDVMDMYHKLIELNDNPLAKQRFGGDAELSRGGKQAQADVRIVSLFSGLVELNAQGEAEVALDIPDFNGRLRLMAVAFTNEQYGHADKEVTVAAPVVTQISMPRFLAPGDKSTLAVDIHNLSGRAAEFDVDLQTSAPVTILAKAQRLSLKDKEKATLTFPVEATYPTGSDSWDSQVVLKVNGIEEYPVKQQWRLSLRPAYPAVTRTLQGVLKTGDSLSLETDKLSDLVMESVEARVSMNSSVNLQIQDQLEHLLRYPYGCLEQTTSSTYPWLFATADNLERMGLKNKTGKQRNESIEHGLKTLASRQLSNGAYGLWSNTSAEEHWVTAYVGNFLVDARDQGVSVSDEQFNKTMGRLEDYLRRRNGNYGHRYSSDNDHYALAYRAYAGYVLARLKRARLGDLRHLADKLSGNAKGALPLVHLGIALSLQGDKARAQKMFDKALLISRDSRRYYGDYGSPARDMALSVYLMLKHQVNESAAVGMSFKLADALRQRSYLSTQERNALFLAGLALDTRLHDNWQADIALKGAVETIQQASSFARKYDYTDLDQGIVVTNKSADSLFTSIDYLGYTQKAPKPESGRFSIERSYFDTKGNRITPTELEVGDLVVVYLNVTSKDRSPDALVVDLLPAGLELENQNLKHAIKLDDIEVEDKPLNYWYERTRIMHQEYRDDRFVAAVDLDRWYHGRLVYLARAVTPGEYQVPPPFVEDMYAPEDRAIGHTLPKLRIVQP